MITETRFSVDGPGPGASDAEYGVNVYLRRKDDPLVTKKVTVWYVSGSPKDSTRPRTAVQPYLNEAVPPTDLLVHAGGVSDISDRATE